jgi:hypothetical protein
MTAPEFLTFDGGIGDEGPELPRRPSTEDLGGDDKLDDAEHPPDPVEHPTAAGHNQMVRVIAALVKTAAVCKLEVRFSGGTPYVARAPALGTAVTLTTFTVVDNGTGDTTITWPANTFPAAACSPSGLTLLTNSTAELSAGVDEITNGIRVRTRSGGAVADIPFTIDLN